MTTVYNGNFTDTTGPYGGSLYPYTDPNQGSYITSPSGVYVAYLTPNVQFDVQRGSTPNPSGPEVVWSTPVLNNITSNPQADAHLFNNGQFNLYDINDPNNGVAYNVSPGGSDRSGATMSLSDSGTLTVNQGRSPGALGTQYFSNNISDPVASLAITQLSYDFAGATVTSTTPLQSAKATNLLKNNTSVPQLLGTSLSLAYTKTSSWNFGVSEAIAVGVKSTTSVGVPGVGQESAELSATSTTTISGGHGGSDTFSTGFGASVQGNVPAFSTYLAKLTGTTENFDVPFTYDALATYSTGFAAAVHGSGVYSGSDSGVFTSEIDCVSQPGGCPTGPISEELVGGGGLGSGVPVGIPAPVPEPASLPLLPAALLATAVIRQLRTRSGRRIGPGRMARRGAQELASLAE